MLEIYCPKCLSFTPLVFDEPYQWQGTQAAARNVICTQCLSVLCVLRGDSIGAHALQKMAELAYLAYYALPTDPIMATSPLPPVARPSRKDKRRLKLVP